MTVARGLLFLGSVIYALAQSPAPRPSVLPETVVLRVGNVKLTAAQFDAIADSLPEPDKQFAKGPGRKQFAVHLARVLVLAEEGRRRKLDEKPEFQIASKYRSEEVLADLAQAAIGGDVKLDDGVLRGYYRAHLPEYERVRVRHILIRAHGSPVPLKPGAKDLSGAEALAKALELRRRIQAGRDFAAVAAAESDDSSSAKHGGELGWVRKGQMAPTFEEAAFQLEPGQVSEPVKTPFGYHLIAVEDRQFDAFEEVKGGIAKKLRSDRTKKAWEQLQKNVNIDYDAAFFGSAKP